MYELRIATVHSATRPVILVLRLSCTTLHPHTALSCPVSPTPCQPAVTASTASLLWPSRGEGWKATALCLTSFPPWAERLCRPRKVVLQSRASAWVVAAPDGSGSGSGKETPAPRWVVAAGAFQRGESSARGETPTPQKGRRIMRRPITTSCAAAPKRQQSLPGTGPSLPVRSAAAQGRGREKERHSGRLKEKLLWLSVDFFTSRTL